MNHSWTITLVTTALVALGTDGFQFGSSAAAGTPVYNMVTSSYLSKCPEDLPKEERRPPFLNSPQPHYEQLPPPPPPPGVAGPVNGVPTLTGFVMYPPAGVRQVGPPAQLVPPQQFQPGPPPTGFIQGPPPTEFIQGPPPTEFIQGPPPTEFIQGPPPTEFIQRPSPTEFIQGPPPTEFIKRPPPTEFIQGPYPTEFIQGPPQTQIIQRTPTPTQILQNPPLQQFFQSQPPTQFIQSSPPSPLPTVQVQQWQPSKVPLYQQTPSDRPKANPFMSSHIMSIPRRSEPPSYSVAAITSASSPNTAVSAPPPTTFRYTQRPPLFASCPATVFFPSTQALAFPGQIPSVIFPTPPTCPAQQQAATFSSGPAYSSSQSSPFLASNKSIATIAAEAAASPNYTSSDAAGATTTTPLSPPKDLLKRLKANTKNLLPLTSLEAENKDCSMPTPPPHV